MKKIIAALLILCTVNAHAQLTQIIRGTVTDQVLQKPVEGASVSIAGTRRGTTLMR